MAEAGEDDDNFMNPLGKAKTSKEGAASFENEADAPSRKTNSRTAGSVKAFDTDSVDAQNDVESWGTLAAGNAFIHGDIDAAILVSPAEFCDKPTGAWLASPASL